MNITPANMKMSSLFIICTVIGVILAIIPIGLGYLDRNYFTHSEFVPIGPQEHSPDISVSNENIPQNDYESIPVYGTSMGLLDAPVTIVIYSDFLCSACREFAISTEKEIEDSYVKNGDVRLIYKHFLTHGEFSIIAAQAAECAAEQNMFWGFHDTLMQKRPSVEDISMEYLENIAVEAGLNPVVFRDSLVSGKYREKVISENAAARESGINGSPTYYINKLKGHGYLSFPEFSSVIEELLGNK